ncbi:hypothetical protein JOB18_035790 [Solea senegalensis]|uniref:BZIP domain-containing protein n=1 Tax=Solea senegalensis TaxID=28829 RepID=A0AAV6SUJ7_SOLSE|nr:hypothetical protein JOB18_035790 [Solea senegalensis]
MLAGPVGPLNCGIGTFSAAELEKGAARRQTRERWARLLRAAGAGGTGGGPSARRWAGDSRPPGECASKNPPRPKALHPTTTTAAAQQIPASSDTPRGHTSVTLGSQWHLAVVPAVSQNETSVFSDLIACEKYEKNTQGSAKNKRGSAKNKRGSAKNKRVQKQAREKEQVREITRVCERVTNVCGKAARSRAAHQPTTTATPVGPSISASAPGDRIQINLSLYVYEILMAG